MFFFSKGRVIGGRAAVGWVLAAACASASAALLPGTVDLNGTPPDLTSSVDPNIVVTFDDSGSMANAYMGDTRPFDEGSWSGPWRCAGQIDPRITDAANLRSRAMNGVYYNPNVTYSPPVNADGTVFSPADASLAAVWNDGVTANRPRSPSGASSVTGFLGARTCTRTTCTDKRWTCGYGTNPLTDTGGPYYYRLKSDAAFVRPNNTVDTSVLYNVNNWEAVAVDASERQNFANWFAYYRTRNLMTRTALSRAFGGLGSNIRVAWQNINDSNYLLPASSIVAALADQSGCSMSSADPAATPSATTAPACYRSMFFNWIFQVPASGGTPDRAATIRAGKFFERGTGNTGASGNLKDPYWEPPAGTGTPARELSCRQNFHMLVTDGYWNEDNPSKPTGFFGVQSSRSLPDGRAFTKGAAVSQVYWDVPASPSGTCADGGNKCDPSLADIGFYYWARDLRTDLSNTVPPYLPDKTTGVTGGTALGPGDSALDNTEIYFNPANDPATWQHVVQFMVTLGVAGTLNYPGDLGALRRGQATSAGSTGWPLPVRNQPEAIDDTWHAAVNSRGSYFSAANPNDLVEHLTDVVSSILQRRGASTALSVTLPILTSGTEGFRAGYDTSDWAGFLTKQTLDANGSTGRVVWDASCILTGGACPSTGQNIPTPRTPDSRVILTSDGTAGSGKPFRWSRLSSTQQASLNANPALLQLQLVPPVVVPDGFGSERLSYLRGDRGREVVGVPQFRHRSSVLGAVVNAQPVYVSSPTSGLSDRYPAGSPEAVAAAAGQTYAKFVAQNSARAPTVYVAANDGMLHAFSATDGAERWAYVPNILFSNYGLSKVTNVSAGLVTTVDDQPLVYDAFINGSWKTVLVGTMRLGGRGVYALDITRPDGVSEQSSSTVLWEYSNTSAGGGNLGYTYGSQNIARLKNGKWVVLVSSGYFPKDALDPASQSLSAARTSLLVLDLATGALIREIPTSSAPQFGTTTTFGLSTPAVYDLGSDQIDDLAVAGDLAGNLWRFDLSDPAPANWKVDLMFQADAAGTFGQHPISVMPVGMLDPGKNAIVWVFGTGKFLGKEDRTSDIPTQVFYGIQDLGTRAAGYPILKTTLQTQSLSQDASGRRFVTANSVASTQKGWVLPLNLSQEPGERVVIAVTPIYSSNRVIATTLIPKGDDPCDPGRRGAVMILDAATGGAPSGTSPISGGTAPAGQRAVGLVKNSDQIPIVGGLPTLIPEGGGSILIPGFNDPSTPPLTITDDDWHRSAWRQLFNLQ